MVVVGFDSTVLTRPVIEQPSVPEGVSPSVYRPTDSGGRGRGYELVFKAMLGASVTTDDEDTFRKEYDNTLDAIFGKHNLPRKRFVYKGAHLTKQFLHRAPQLMAEILESLSSVISHLDIYSAYYNQPYVSCYGEAQGQRVLPIVFIERNQNAFPHVCAWKYLMYHHSEAKPRFHLDHFQGKITPAWRVLTTSDALMEIYFSGGECNPLIAVPDLALRFTEIFQHGNVDGRSLLEPLQRHVPSVAPRIRFHNLGGRGEDQHHTAPVLPLDIDTEPFIKRPMFYIVWKESGRKDLKDIFEWGRFYNETARHVSTLKGAMKFFDPHRDMIVWDPSKDFAVPVTKEDEDYLTSIKKMGHDMPPVFRLSLTT